MWNVKIEIDLNTIIHKKIAEYENNKTMDVSLSQNITLKIIKNH